VGHVAYTDEIRNKNKILMKYKKRNLEDKGTDGRIVLKVDVMEVGSEGMDWIHLA
jgi:hypothetical protein